MTNVAYLRVAIYARVSSDQQAEAGTIASQVQALRERLVLHNLPLEEELCFIDDGYSGTTLVRPALERLRDLAASGGLDRLYVHSPDRLARKYAYQVLLLDEFRRCGVEVVFLNHAIGDSPEEHLLLQVQGMVAEYERAKLLERCRRGKLHAARQGSVNALAGAPYGYRYVRKAEGGGIARYDIVLEEARVVQQIFDWVGRERVSLGEVCRRLHQQGIRTRTGNLRWDPSTLAGMLKNPTYQGTAVYGRTQVGQRRPRLRAPRGQPDQPRRPYSIYAAQGPGVPITVPALVSPELFATVGEQLEENRQRNRQSRRGARWLLQGLLVCRQCGYALYGIGTRHRLASGEQLVHAYYRCMGRNGHRFGGQRLCSNRQVRVEDLDEAVWQDVCSLLRNPGKIQAEYERRQADQDSQEPALSGGQLTNQLKKVKQAITRLIDAYQEGLLDKTEFEPRLRTAKERLARLEAEARDQAARKTQDQELRLALGCLEEFAAQVETGLAQAEWATRREIIRALVKRIEVSPEEVRVLYRVSPPPFVKGPQGGTLQHCGRVLEPALPDVAAAMVVLVVATDVRVQQPVHEAAQVAIGGRHHDEVEVVGHQAVAQHRHRHLDAGMGDRLEEGLVIAVLAKNFAPAVTAVDDMIADPTNRRSCGTRHS
jgi:site-specific DNA recombinase